MDLPELLGGVKVFEYLLSATGVLNVPKAYFESRAENIRSAALRRRLLKESNALVRSNELLQSAGVSPKEFLKHANVLQAEKNVRNLILAFAEALDIVGDSPVPDKEPNHDWTARLGSIVKDVSSEEARSRWGRLIAGEVLQPGSYSLRTLRILSDIDPSTASLFAHFCSHCIYRNVLNPPNTSARVCSLGSHAGQNSLRKYKLDYQSLARLIEHDLIMEDLNTWHDFASTCGILVPELSEKCFFPMSHQGKNWILLPLAENSGAEFKINGPAMTQAGREIATLVDIEPAPEYTKDLQHYFRSRERLLIETEHSNVFLMSDAELEAIRAEST